MFLETTLMNLNKRMDCIWVFACKIIIYKQFIKTEKLKNAYGLETAENYIVAPYVFDNLIQDNILNTNTMY